MISVEFWNTGQLSLSPAPPHQSLPTFTNTQLNAGGPSRTSFTQPEHLDYDPTPSYSQHISDEQSRVSALRGELQNVQAGVVRILSGLQELGEEVPGLRESVLRSDWLETRLESASAGLRISSSTMPEVSSNNANRRGRSITQVTARDNMVRLLDHDRTLYTSFPARPPQALGAEGLPPTSPNSLSNSDAGPALVTREHVESPDYQSPIAGMYQRAYDRYHQAESRRRERTQQITSDCPQPFLGQHNPPQTVAQLSSRNEPVSSPWPVTPSESGSVPLFHYTTTIPTPATTTPSTAPRSAFNPLQYTGPHNAAPSSNEVMQSMTNPLVPYPGSHLFVPYATNPNAFPSRGPSYLSPTTSASTDAYHFRPGSTATQPRTRQPTASRRRQAAYTDLHPARAPFVSPAGHDEPMPSPSRRAATEGGAPLVDAANTQNFQYGRHAEMIQYMMAQGLSVSQLLGGDRRGIDGPNNTPKVTFDTQARPPALTDEELMTPLGCSICHEHKIDTVILPCGHAIMCKWCAELHVPGQKNGGYVTRGCDAHCPVCRKQIKELVGFLC